MTTAPRNRRPLQAIILNGPGDSPYLLGPLQGALDGSGPAVLPVDGSLPAAQVSRLLDAFGPDEVVVAGPGAGGRAAAARAGGRARDGKHAGAGEDTAVIIGTSGSTGAPKGVELSAGALLASARASMARVGAGAGERWLACLPVSHVAGLQVLVRALLSGVAPAVATTADAGALAGAGAAHVSVVPTQLVRLMGSGPGRAALAAYSSVLVGGAAAASTLLAEARAAGVPVVTTYGMSETCGGCVYDGVPLDGVSVRSGDDGRLRISGPVLMNRYFGQPGLTAEALVAGGPAGREYVTSDLGRVDEAGRVVIRGRADDVINTGGHKVVPGEVATALSTHPEVREVVVVGRPDPEWGERVIAVIVPARREYPPSLELLRIHVREALPRYASPSEVVLVDAIPVLSNGKPDLARLRRVACQQCGTAGQGHGAGQG